MENPIYEYEIKKYFLVAYNNKGEESDIKAEHEVIFLGFIEAINMEAAAAKIDRKIAEKNHKFSIHWETAKTHLLERFHGEPQFALVELPQIFSMDNMKKIISRYKNHTDVFNP